MWKALVEAQRKRRSSCTWIRRDARMDLLTLAEAAAMTRKRKPPCCCYRHEGRGLDVAFSAAILRHAFDGPARIARWFE